MIKPSDLLSLRFDGVDRDFGERLPVAVLLPVALAALLVEYDHFVAFQVRKNAGAHFSAFNVGHADGYFTVIVNQMNSIETHRVAFVGCQPVDEDLLTFLNFKLLTGDGNDSEHVLLIFL